VPKSGNVEVPPAVEKHDALFRVLAQKSIACLKFKAASQPPATSTRTQPFRPKSIRRQPPAPSTDISQFNDKVSHDTARRRRKRLLVGAGGKARPGGAHDEQIQQTNLTPDLLHTAQPYKRNQRPCTIKTRYQRPFQTYLP
jgi:hypothetical protein